MKVEKGIIEYKIYIVGKHVRNSEIQAKVNR